jgi:hypothetical protein
VVWRAPGDEKKTRVRLGPASSVRAWWWAILGSNQ